MMTLDEKVYKNDSKLKYVTHHKVKPSYKILSSNTMLSLSSDVYTTKLLSLDLVSRALGLPKSNVPYPN